MLKHIVTFALAVLLSHSLLSQYSLSGKVINEHNEGLVAASVFFVDTHLGAATDEKGHFTIADIPAGNYDLKVSYIGYADYTESLIIDEDIQINIVLGGTLFDLNRIEITANKLDKVTPFTYIEMDKEDIDLKNMGFDVPILLEHTPSVVVTSDAGAGVGYTGVRVRGSDATRVNVTINGVPLNDSESHGVFWVDLPDFGSSTQSIQLQRGVGPSTNGTGSFGATIGLSTMDYRLQPYAELQSTFGSFNTQKFNAVLGTGLMNDQFFVEGRYSIINSDGYIDRASSKLNSWYLSAGRIGKNHSIRLNAFSGHELTYQSWNGVPEALVKGDKEGLLNHYYNNSGTYATEQDSFNLFTSDRRYNYYLYQNQVDDYRQDHYQLIYNVEPVKDFILNITGHYTRGRGFYEQFRHQDDFADYGIAEYINEGGDTISSNDLVRRRWLDNHFYGIIANASYAISDKQEFIMGGGINRYNGLHYGEVIDVEGIADFSNSKYYESDGSKTDMNIYTRLNSSWTDRWSSFIDLQYRAIQYNALGTDNGGGLVDIDQNFNFFNPKAGITYSINPLTQIYASVAVANREPVRSDFLDAIGTVVPKPERLMDYELGYRHTTDRWVLNANVYHMQYTDQLVVTGAINDVGASVRVNVDNSYRQGIELDMSYHFNDQLSWSPNITLSRNKINAFDDVLIDFTHGFDVINTELTDTDIALSPSIIAGSRWTYSPIKNLKATWQSKYVGKQYLDNTNTDSKSLDAYWANDIILGYSLKDVVVKELEFKLIINNILNTFYSSNGYTYSYKYIDTITENFLYPQAGIHFVGGVTVKF